MSYTQLYTYRTLEFGAFARKTGRSNYAVLGVPFDFTSTYRPGSRFAPNAIREASQNLEAYCLRKSFDVETVGLEDLGDVDVLGDVENTMERVKRIVKEVHDSGKFPVVLGGEHTVTYGCVKAFEDTAVLSFDAHLDLRDEYIGKRLSHATFMRRLCEELGSDHFFEVGPRAICEEEIDFAAKKKVRHCTSLQVFKNGIDKIAAELLHWSSQFGRLYITIDMDVLDPAYAPGVGNPVPEGLSSTQLLEILEKVVTRKVVGLDVVEVSPHYDSGLTAIQASNLIYNILAFRETSNKQSA